MENESSRNEEVQVTISNYFEFLNTLAFFIQDQNNQFNAKKDRLRAGIQKLKEANRAMREIFQNRKEKSKPEVEQEIKDWEKSFASHQAKQATILGNCVLGAAMITYAGVLSSDRRAEVIQEWSCKLRAMGIPYEDDFMISSFLCPRTILNWHKAGLPVDKISVENAIILNKCRRWPIIIDPESQAKTFIKNWAAQQKQPITIIKATDSKLPEQLSTGVSSGKWVLLEMEGNAIPKSVEPLLLDRIAKKESGHSINLKNKEVRIHQSFRLFVVTTSSRPTFSPEIFSLSTVINFNLTCGRLKQLAQGELASLEWPDLDQQKKNCHADNVEDGFNVKYLEDSLLKLLVNSEGDLSKN